MQEVCNVQLPLANGLEGLGPAVQSALDFTWTLHFDSIIVIAPNLLLDKICCSIDWAPMPCHLSKADLLRPNVLVTTGITVIAMLALLLMSVTTHCRAHFSWASARHMLNWMLPLGRHALSLAA